MTREEAKRVLEFDLNHKHNNESKEALRMAIKALEQEPCEDSISRQAALASIRNLYPDIPVMDIFGARRKWLEKYAPYFECENAIKQIPSVNPTKKSERGNKR